MSKFKIIQDHEGCIGCGSCAAICPAFWEIGEDNKANLKRANTNLETKEQELEIEEVGCNQEAVDACPVKVIRIKKL